MALTDEVGKALRFLRKRRAMTQKAVAEAADISKNLLSNWETGTTAPSLSSLEKVMAVLNVDLLELYNTMNLMAGKPFRETRRASYGDRPGYNPTGIPDGERGSELMNSLLLFVGLLRMMAQATRDAGVLEELEQLLKDRIDGRQP